MSPRNEDSIEYDSGSYLVSEYREESKMSETSDRMN